MKTIDALINKHDRLNTDEEGNKVMYFWQIKDLLIDYGKEVLNEAAKKALIIRNPTGEGGSSEILTASNFMGDLGYEEYIPVSYTINKESILNIIKELK